MDFVVSASALAALIAVVFMMIEACGRKWTADIVVQCVVFGGIMSLLIHAAIFVFKLFKLIVSTFGGSIA